MSSPAVELKKISKTFPGVRALQDVSLQIRPGTIRALVGENGAGKSTLINILSGVFPPDGGEIYLAGQQVHFSTARQAHREGVIVVHQEGDLFSDLSVAENLGLEQGLPRSGLLINSNLLHKKARQALQKVGEGIPIRQIAARLSPAQRQMVLIAGAMQESPRVLILDEPTSSLSETESKILFDHLRQFRSQGVAILYVSHRLEEVFALADEVTVLRDGEQVWTGLIGETNKSDLISKMVGRQQENEPPPLSSDSILVDRPPIFCSQDLSAADGSFRNVSVDIKPGEILGLYGLIGAGRTEWAQGVFALRNISKGKVWIKGREVIPRSPGQMTNCGVAYIPEDRLRQGICPQQSTLANAVLAILRRISVGPWIPHSREKKCSFHLMTTMRVRAHSPDQVIGTLSGGNQQKVVVGRWLATDPSVLILDEPTRGVDVGAKGEIHALIRRFAEQGKGIIFISSELPEILEQCHRVGVFREGQLVSFFQPSDSTAEEIAAAAVPEGTNEDTGNGEVETKYSLFSFIPGVRELGLLLLLIGFFVGLHIYTGDFLTSANLDNILTSAALLCLPALGVSFVILAGGIDISLGRLMALSAGVAVVLWTNGYPAWIACIAAILVGMAGGGLNALLSLAGRVHPIVVTLATMSLFHGMVQRVLKVGILDAPGNSRDWLIQKIAGIPPLGLLGLAVFILAAFILHWTVPGRELYAMGSNPRAAHRIGIGKVRVWFRAFLLQGALVGLAGFLGLTFVGSVETSSFENVTLQAIAAAVIGGVAITGGRGSPFGVMLGCLFLASLEPACIELQISTHWQKTVVGAVMAVAVTLDALWRKGRRQ